MTHLDYIMPNSSFPSDAEGTGVWPQRSFAYHAATPRFELGPGPKNTRLHDRDLDAQEDSQRVGWGALIDESLGRLLHPAGRTSRRPLRA